MSASLLVELFTEELPPKALKQLGVAFGHQLQESLMRERLKTRDPAGTRFFATPRRLAVLIKNVLPVAPDRGESRKLMPTKVAFGSDGRPSPALTKRLEKEGGREDQVERKTDGGTEYVFLNQTIRGVTLAAGLQTAPDGSGAKLAGILGAHCGSVADGDAALRPLKQFGPPVMDAIGPIPYSVLNTLIDGAFPKGALNYWKSSFLAGLSDEVIAIVIDRFSVCPSPMSHLLLEHFHGAASRVPIDSTASTMRVSGFNVVIVSQWLDPAENDRHIAWARDTYSALQPYLGTTRYVNYLGGDEDGDPAAAVYGPNYARLRELKTKYDPDNLFRGNVNVRPR